jgi:hypothetical protein
MGHAINTQEKKRNQETRKFSHPLVFARIKAD